MSSAGRDIRKTVIADGVYQFMVMRDAYVRQLNTVVIVNDHDVLVFDTNTRPSSARLILAEIRKITSKPVRYVVNSHHHPDHWSGNEVYADAFPDADFIASERTLQLMQDTAGLWVRRFSEDLAAREQAMAKASDDSPEQRKQDQEDLDNYRTFVEESRTLRRVYPTLTYVNTLTLRHGGREFRFMSVTGDAEGTTVLYLPKEKVLITGDAVSYPIPYVSAKPGDEANGLRKLAELDADVIVPGHGPAFHDKTFLRMQLDLIDKVRSGTRDALRAGAQSLEEVQKTVTVDELREPFAHGDPDLVSRFQARVKFLVKVSIRELGQDY